MSQPAKLDEVLRDWWQSEMYKRGLEIAGLQTTPGARTVITMTTNEDYEIIRRVALLIEDEVAVNAVMPENAKEQAKAYVRNTLDNGFVGWSDDTPVWELVQLLGHNRDGMDSLAVYHQIAALIDENDFFND